MSKVVQAVIGVAEIVVGAVLDAYSFGTLGNALIAAGAAQLLNVAAQLLNSPHRPPVSPVDINYAGTLEPRRIIYGYMKVGGMHVIPPLTSGSNNDMLHMVLALAGHEIDSFGDVYLGQVRIALADVGSPVTNVVTNNGYEGKVWIRRYDGTQTHVDNILTTTFTVWDSNHIGHGIAYMAIQFQYDQKVFASGLPEPTTFLKGKRVYDPRLDSTNGGSGTQRYTDSTTWTYSTNPALCLRDYLTSSLGLGEAQTRIDDSLVAAAANICDEQVTVPIPILIGLTDWTNGQATVGGTNTAFMAGINNGQLTQSGSNWIPNSPTYVLAPNGSMLQVVSVQSDVQFTLAAAYSGATASSQVTQWNNSTATTTTQARYTCNVVLDSTTRYEDNITQLARAMMGQCIYSGGKWCMYAGAWSGSAFSLSETDLVGSVSVQCATPRQTLYNAVRGNYINPQKNYQPDEFPVVVNTTYAADDGETIYTETNFPCCIDVFECQRNADLLINFSRDQKVATAQYGMSAYGVKVWETGTVTIEELGWVNQSVRCIGWRFQAKGVIELTLQEAYSADFTDPPANFYATHGTLVANQPGFYLPYAPTGLTTKTVPNGIEFNVILPAQVTPGTQIQLWEYAANSPFSSASVIYTGAATDFTILKGDTITRYYWVTTLGPNSQKSAQYPTGNGVAGTGGTIDNSLDGTQFQRLVLGNNYASDIPYNGDFEQWADRQALPEGWTIFQNDNNTMPTARSTSSYSGNYALSVGPNGSSTGTGYASRPFSVQPGKRYKLSCWANSNVANPGSMYLRVAWYNGDAGATGLALNGSNYITYADVVALGGPTVANGWQNFIGVVQAPPNAIFARVAVYNWVSATPSTILFDRVSFVPYVSTYNYGNNTNAAAWMHVGTLVLKDGSSATFRWHAGSGYNANGNQQAIVEWTLRAGNGGAAPNMSGITATVKGGTQPLAVQTGSLSAIMAVATGGSTSTTNTSWEIYMAAASYTLGPLEVLLNTDYGDSFTYSGAATTAPSTTANTYVGTNGAWTHDYTGRIAPYRGAISPYGSIPPGSSDVAFSYTSTTTSITFSWTAGTIYRPDGSTTSVSAGSQAVSGLSASTTYYFGVYYNELTNSIGLSTGSGAVGSPAVACTSKIAAVAAAMIANGVATFGWYSGATTASGSGGGGGGGGCCLHGEQLIELADGKQIMAAQLEVDQRLQCPSGPVRVTKLRAEPWCEWFRVTLSDGVSLLVAGDHRFMSPDDEQICARQIRLQQVVQARRGYVEVMKLEVVREPGSKISIEVEDPHTYYVQGILSHNKNLC